MPDATFATPDVTTFCRLDELGLVVVGQHLQPDRAVLAHDRRLPPPRPGRRTGRDEQHHYQPVRGRPGRADTELRTLGRTLKKRAEDVLAYFDRPGTSNGPTEAVNGRLEHLRGSALGFRNLAHYIARSLLETGGFRPRLHPQS